MTNFAQSEKAKAKEGRGKSWLAAAKDEVGGVFARCVADYDGESVEDFVSSCHEAC